MSLKVNTDCDAVFDIHVEGGELAISYGATPVAQCASPFSGEAQIFPFPPSGQILKIVASDTATSAMKCTLTIKVVNRKTKQVLLSSPYKFENSSGGPSGQITAIDIPVEV